MTTLEMTMVHAGIGTVGLLLGWILRGAKSWFGISADVQYTKEKVKKVDTDLDLHMRDTDRHLVRGREDAVMVAMTENFRTLNLKLDTINTRCEKRLESCQVHFSTLDQKFGATRLED